MPEQPILSSFQGFRDDTESPAIEIVVNSNYVSPVKTSIQLDEVIAMGFFKLFNRGYACAMIVNTWVDQLLPQFLMETVFQ